jgi:hypothetical protein
MCGMTVRAPTAAQVVFRYLRSHPEKLNNDFVWLIMNALGEAWACR